jgi:hypothetical protein
MGFDAMGLSCDQELIFLLPGAILFFTAATDASCG